MKCIGFLPCFHGHLGKAQAILLTHDPLTPLPHIIMKAINVIKNIFPCLQQRLALPPANQIMANQETLAFITNELAARSGCRITGLQRKNATSSHRFGALTPATALLPLHRRRRQHTVTRQRREGVPLVRQQGRIDKMRHKALFVGECDVVDLARDVLGLFALGAIHQRHARTVTGRVAHRMHVFEADIVKQADHQRAAQIQM